MVQNHDKTLAVVGSVAWVGLAIPGVFFSFIGFLGIGFGGGVNELTLGWFLILFPVLAISSVLACWLLRGFDHPRAARIAILIPAIPAIFEVALMFRIMMR